MVAAQYGTSGAQTAAQAGHQESVSLGLLKIVLHETDGPHDRSIALGDGPGVVELVECRTKRASRRGGRKKIAPGVTSREASTTHNAGLVRGARGSGGGGGGGGGVGVDLGIDLGVDLGVQLLRTI